MPWQDMSQMDQRREFVSLACQGTVPIAELCRRFGISRETGHRLLRRHAALGEAALVAASRRPLTSPRRTAGAIEQQVLALRDAHPAWGGRKLARRLRNLASDQTSGDQARDQHGPAVIPQPSTVTEILRRHGRLDPAEAAKHSPCQRFERARPNELWQMDFKGHFQLRQGRCHPLTVLDDHCRYALGLRACADEQDATVRDQLSALFRRHGLPDAILCDNGSPWGHPGPNSAGPNSAGSSGAGQGMAYTALGVWLLRLGIALKHGRPYHPQTQGKEERFHRTLKREVLQMRAPMADLATAQDVFDDWREVYNHQRPHEALGLQTPASRYQPSSRTFPDTLPEPEYDHRDIIRRVSTDGCISFRARHHRIGLAFARLDVALRPDHAEGLWSVFFSRFNVAKIDLRDTQA